MANDAYTVWYRIGNVAVTKNSSTVTGTATYWLSAGIKPGDMFSTDGSQWYEVASVTDSSHITLKTNYLGNSGTGLTYSVIRNFNSGMSARVSAEAAQLLGYFDQYVDADMQSIHGKSAYEVAVQNGYVGTQTQWLESLKAAGEWTKATESIGALETQAAKDETNIAANATAITRLNTLANHLDNNLSTVRTSVMGFRDLGTEVTDEHKAALRGGFKDLAIGDSWTINNRKYNIAMFTNHIFGSLASGTMLLSPVLYMSKMNEEATNEGGYYGSWLFSEGLQQAEEIITEDWGDMVYSTTEVFPNKNTSGWLSWGSQKRVKCFIPTHKQVYGYPYAPYPQEWYSYYSNIQLPIFMFMSTSLTLPGGGNFWLQECSNGTTSFCYQGDSSHHVMNATTESGVRVLFFVR